MASVDDYRMHGTLPVRHLPSKYLVKYHIKMEQFRLIKLKLKPIKKISYSLRFILIVAHMDVSRHILVLDTSILLTSNMDRRENQLYSDGSLEAIKAAHSNTKQPK
jgi:hypothetical protein